MKVTIEIRNRVAGKYNTPCTVKEAFTEQRITVQQYINDLYYSKKIEGAAYLNALKTAMRLIKKNDESGLSNLLSTL